MESQITFDKIVAECGVKLQLLEKECAEEKLLKLAKYCDPISVVGHALGLTQPQITAIENDYKTTEEKRLALMKIWKQTYAFNATYKKFIEALLDSGRAEQATEVCRMFIVEEEKKASQPDGHSAASYDSTSDVRTSVEDATDLNVTSDPSLTSTGASTPTLTSDDVKHVPVLPEESETVQLTEIPSDFRFNSVSHGESIILSEDGLEARWRDRYDDKTGVYVATPLQGTCEFEVEVTDCDSTTGGSLWIGVSSAGDSLMIGVSQCPTGPYKHLDIPHKSLEDSCVWSGDSVKNGLSGDIIETKYGSMNLHNLRIGEKVLVRLSENGDLHFFLNGVDQGLASRNVYREGWDTYPVIRVSGSCKAVKITRAVIPKYAKGHRGQQSSENISPHNIQFGFHPVTGRNIVLLEDGLYARRINPDELDGGVVYGAMPIKHCGTFGVVITEHEQYRGGDSIKIGVMRRPTNTELNQSDVPYNSKYFANHFVWSGEKVHNNLSGHSDYRGRAYGPVNLDDLREGDKVGLRLSSDGTLFFFVNAKNQGVAARRLHQEGYDIYPMVDVRSNCHAVRITRADEVPDLQELCVEKIASCLDSGSSKDVNLLPLPQRLMNQIEQYIDCV